MKELFKNHLRLRGFVVIFFGLLLSPFVHGDELVVTESQVTASSADATTPRLGNDGISDLIVYTYPSGDSSQSYIWYQRLNEYGVPYSFAYQIPGGPNAMLNDVSGDFIVFTAFDDVDERGGQFMLYQISTKSLQQIYRPDDIENNPDDIVREARIHGDKIVWVEGENGSTMVMYYELDWIGTPRDPVVVAGINPPASDVEIGDRYAVWSEQIGGQRDVFAYDLAAFRRSVVAASSLIDESAPSTSGEWVVWQANDSLGSRIEAYNVDTRETRTIIDDGFGSSRPSIHGDLIAYENDSTGDLEVYIYRLSTGDTFRVTSHPANQYLTDVFGDLVAYVDMRNGSEDIYVSKLDFLTGPPPNEQIANILDFIDLSVYEGTLIGSGPGKSADHKLNALKNMLNKARDLIEAELYDDACRQLSAVYKKTDGIPKPPDFIEGEAAAELAQLILDLMSRLGCR